MPHRTGAPTTMDVQSGFSFKKENAHTPCALSFVKQTARSGTIKSIAEVHSP